MGLKIVNRYDYEKISWGQAFARYWAACLSSLILAIGYLMAADDPEKQALHDLICKTYVINIREEKKSKLIFIICLCIILLIPVSYI